MKRVGNKIKGIELKVNLPVDFLREGNKFIAYSPALDIATCGDSFEEAKKRFEELVSLFFEELLRKGTLEEVLREYGWEKVENKWNPPVYITHTQHLVKIPMTI